MTMGLIWSSCFPAVIVEADSRTEAARLLPELALSALRGNYLLTKNHDRVSALEPSYLDQVVNPVRSKKWHPMQRMACQT